MSFNQISDRPSGSASFGSQSGPVSQLVVSCEKERWQESPSSQPKQSEQHYSVSAIQDERGVPIKVNVVTKGQNVQDRPEGRILCKSPFGEIEEVHQVPVERSSIKVLLSLPRPFFRSQSLLRKLGVGIINYLDEMLLMVSSL